MPTFDVIEERLKWHAGSDEYGRSTKYFRIRVYNSFGLIHELMIANFTKRRSKAAGATFGPNYRTGQGRATQTIARQAERFSRTESRTTLNTAAPGVIHDRPPLGELPRGPQRAAADDDAQEAPNGTCASARVSVQPRCPC
jgi:hypothetical protein